MEEQIRHIKEKINLDFRDFKDEVEEENKNILIQVDKEAEIKIKDSSEIMQHYVNTQLF